MNIYSLVAGATAMLLFGSGIAAADCGKVTITEMNWASAAIVTSVSKFLMEKGYGCDVQVVQTSVAPAVTSIAEKGEPDIVTELWINSAPMYEKLEAEGKVVTLGNALSDGGIGGYWIPAYLAEAHPELTKLEGILAHPELVGGRFHSCPEGWGCRIVADNLQKAWDFEGHGLKVFNHGSGETLAASIEVAYTNKEPWFGYYWSPTPTMAKFPLVKVDMGEYVEAIHTCNRSADCPNPGKSGYPRDRVLTASTSAFLERQPDVADLMRKVSFTNEMMNSLLKWQFDKKATAEETAVHFLSNHKAIWSAWLNEAAKAKLATLLK
ncbi:ABC transporter substrate-binding protein [Allomesorhizobium camelthorni]|uniref:ABC transporter substrate-binding protein n=1 Tax=Allomesorhizobium camelthorni TaxID=475069 RepID=A0A6G4WM27_9HYPH|nr:ABC transporter substrate-binding protein [Mesorhizobium camelthorni]NGO55821.1 ABC transporter substrate-binding protein [Mesorhizobium camelthorni]